MYEKMAVYDKNGSHWIRKIDPIQHLVNECDLIFVAVPTPMNPDGSCDTSIVESVINGINNKQSEGDINVVIKSTVPPGTTKMLSKNYRNVFICFSPEFLREASAIDDFNNQTHVIAGGDVSAVRELRNVCRVAFPSAEFLECDSKVAEMVKYVVNCFLATKVSFANEIKQICDALIVYYDLVIDAATKDVRLGDSHWQVPGPMPADDDSGNLLPGFSGSCFVKDINSLISVAADFGVDPKVMRAAWGKNLEVRPERDWEHLVGRAVTVRRTLDE
jgi:UDPglucose 6-dehydrogenase